MPKIIAKHSSIHITDYELGDCTRLEHQFSIFDPVYHKYNYKAIFYDENNKELIVPRGIDLFYLEKLFSCEPYIDKKHDEYDTLNTIHLTSMPRDDVQKEALAFLCGERKYFHNKVLSQLSLNLNTGKGKTYCTIAATAYYRTRSMIITSSLDWLEQWKNEILNYTDTKPSEIFMLVGSPSIHRLMKRDMSSIKYILASHDTIKSFGDTHGWEKITELFKHCRIGIKAFDEAHLNFDNMAQIDAYTNTARTFYVTATLLRSDKDENIVFQYYFKNVPSITLFDEEEDPHTAYIAMRYNSKPSPVDITNCRNPYGFDKNKYAGYVVGKDNFYMIVRILIDLAIRNGMKNIFYLATNEAIEVLRVWIIENYPELRDEVGVFTSLIPKEQKAIEIEKKIILSTTKSLGTAMDVKGLKMTVVLAEPFRSEVLARQTLGRTRADDTFYVDIIDDGFDSIKRYYKEKLPIFNKYATDTKEIRLSQIELEQKVNAIMTAREELMKRIIPIYYFSIPTTQSCCPIEYY